MTNEIPNGNGGRFGFELIDNKNHKDVLAHINSKSPTRVSRYGVNVDSLDEFLKPLCHFKPVDLLYIDEIGQMELYSDRFIELVRMYLESDNNFIGTLSSVFDHKMIVDIKSNPTYRIYEVNEKNRDNLNKKLITELEL